MKTNVEGFSQVDHSRFGLDQEYLLKGFENEEVKAYFKYQVDMAVIYGADRERAEQELLEALDFQIALANVSGMISKIVFIKGKKFPALRFKN